MTEVQAFEMAFLSGQVLPRLSKKCGYFFTLILRSRGEKSLDLSGLQDAEQTK